MQKTDVTTAQLRAMTEAEFLGHLRQFPYQSQYSNQEAGQFALHYLTHLNGKRYQERGNLEAFTKAKR